MSRPLDPSQRTYVSITRGKSAGAIGFFNGTWHSRVEKAKAWGIPEGDVKCFVFGTGQAVMPIRLANLAEITPLERLMLEQRGELPG